MMCDPHDLRHVLGDKSANWFAAATARGRAVFTMEGGQPIAAGMESAGTVAAAYAADVFEPTLFLYDAYPGGVGFSPKLWDAHADLARRARDLILACPCRDGCPSCVGPAGEVGKLAKLVALEIAGKLVTG